MSCSTQSRHFFIDDIRESTSLSKIKFSLIKKNFTQTGYEDSMAKAYRILRKIQIFCRKILDTIRLVSVSLTLKIEINILSFALYYMKL